MNKVTDQISIERIVALLTALSPFIASSIPVFKSLDPIVQVAAILVAGAAGCVWLYGRIQWNSIKQQIEATK